MNVFIRSPKYRPPGSPSSRDVHAAAHISNCAVRPQTDLSVRLRPTQKRAVRAINQHIHFASAVAGRLIGRNPHQASEASVCPHDLMCGVTIILPGIEAIGPYPEEIRGGLRDGQVPGAIEIFHWGLPFPEGYFRNLMDIRRNRRQAAALAGIILAHQDQYPQSTIHLVANSGGAGPALMAIEMLPLNRPIAGIAILAGAASCGYNLRPVLARCTKGVLNSYSRRDALMLNLGTRIFGTTDRKFAPSCGYRGFTMHDNKVQQLEWTAAYGPQCGWWGTHGTSTSRQFISSHIATWIKAPVSMVPKQSTGIYERNI